MTGGGRLRELCPNSTKASADELVAFDSDEINQQIGYYKNEVRELTSEEKHAVLVAILSMLPKRYRKAAYRISKRNVELTDLVDYVIEFKYKDESGNEHLDKFEFKYCK